MEVRAQLQGIGIDSSSETPVLLLREVAGKRVLPIWIGIGEATAIAVHLVAREFERPLTYDLFASVVRSLGGNLQRVIINRGTGELYFAEMHFRPNGQNVVVDARPSDAIAIALRLNTEILIQEDLFWTVPFPIEAIEAPDLERRFLGLHRRRAEALLQKPAPGE